VTETKSAISAATASGASNETKGAASGLARHTVRLGPDLAVLRRPPLVRLVLAGLISGIGDWLLIIALPVYVFAQTDSTLRSSTTMLIELCAGLLAGQLAGIAVDRFDRRILLITTSVVQAALLLPLLVVHGDHDLGVIYTVSGLQSALGTLAGPAQRALLPSLVADDELLQANTIVGMSGDLAKLIGAAAGGTALAAGGLRGVVLADAASYLAVVVLMAWRFPVPEPRSSERVVLSSPLAAWLEGLRVVRGNRSLFGAVVLILFNGLAQGIAFALVIAFIVTDLSRGSADVGVFRGVVVLGSLPTGIVLATYGRRLQPERVLRLSLLALTLVEFAIWNGPSFTHWFGYYLILQVLAGIPATAAEISFVTIIQKVTPDEYLGRVFGLIGAAGSLALLVSVLVGGALGETYDPRNLLNATVAMDLVTALAAFVMFRSVGSATHGTARAGGPSNPH
jgi:MFS family permease